MKMSRRNPSRPQDMDNEGETKLDIYKPDTRLHFCKPEINPIVRMISQERSARRGIHSIVHLLDQFLLVTPPASEDEEEEPGEIVSPARVKVEADRCLEVEDSPVILDEDLSELLTEAKSKKILVQQASPTEKKKKRTDAEEKIRKRCKYHSAVKKKTLQKKTLKPSPENSECSSPTFDAPSQPRPGIKPSKRPISPCVGRKRRKSPNRSLSPDLDARRPERKSPRYSSPIRRGKSPCRYSPIRWSPALRSRRSPSTSPDRPKSRRPRSLSRQRSPSVSSRRRSPSVFSRLGSPSVSSRRRSPSMSSRRRSPSVSSRRRSPSVSSRRRSPSVFSRLGSPNLSSRHRSPSVSSRRRSPSVSSRRRSPSVSSRRRSPSMSSRRRSPSTSSRYRSRRRSPVRMRARKSPIRASSLRSLVPYRSGSSGQSSDEERMLARLDKTRKAAAAKPEIRRLVVPTGRLRDRPAEEEDDEYSRILAEEMKKRQLVKERGARVEKTAEAPVKTESNPRKECERREEKNTEETLPVKKEPVCAEQSVPVPEDRGGSVSREFGPHPSDMPQPEISVPQPQLVKQEDVKPESLDQKGGSLLNCYYCQACQLGLNSELTWQSHINGKKHAKMLKLQTVHEIAKGSIAIPCTPAVVSEDIPRFAHAPPGKRRYFVPEEAKLTPAVKAVLDLPMPGLDYVQEIQSEMDVNYYCELCDAPCGPSSIMPHLIGYKHQLRSLREISPNRYEKNKDRVKKSFESILKARLRSHERHFGRGRIKVFKEEDDPNAKTFYDFGPSSWRNTSAIPYIKKEIKEDGATEIPINDECLDTSKGDFFCKLCDSHMNNVYMWEAHVRGKRHLKNAKKIPGENISKLKSVRAPNAQSKLEEMIAESHSHNLIVGLDYIKETKGMNGELYNCFLCGSCSTNYDIIDHVLLPKHRLRYLEKLDAEGIENAVMTINQMEFTNPWFRENLVNSECHRMVQEYGRGRVEVYVSKS